VVGATSFITRSATSAAICAGAAGVAVRLTIFAALLALTVRGLFARRMGWRVASAGLLAECCVSGPHLDGHHAYLFHRAKLQAWRHERLTFGETMDMLGISKATLHRWVEQGKLTPLEDMGGKQRWFARGEVELLRNKNM
jgi:predicted DNA-binding transcriptional regulator AlpA